MILTFSSEIEASDAARRVISGVVVPFNKVGNTSAGAVVFEPGSITIPDPKKIKFEQIINDVPNTWYTFVDNQEGKVRFGSLDKELKTPISGELTPFKIRFSAVINPLDINTYINVTPNMDASSKTGYQLGINLSTDSIKLTGYNNF